MIRDMELVRSILSEVERLPSLEGCRIKIEGRTPEEVYYKARLMQEAGLIEVRFLPGSTAFHVLRLTHAGHEFLDAARSDTAWNKAKNALSSATGTLTLEGLKVALPEIIKKLLV